MSGPTIPIINYALIAITTLVLTYVTIMDKAPNSKTTEQPTASSLLPSISGPPTQSVKPPVESQPLASLPNLFNSETPQQNPPQLKIGGKTKRHRRQKHKKTRHV
jgi:hypothetical protein